jgi:hypothetical protein
VTRGRHSSHGDSREVRNPFSAPGAGKAHRRRCSTAANGQPEMDTYGRHRRARRGRWIGWPVARHPGGARGGTGRVGKSTGTAIHEEALRQWGSSSFCFSGLRPDGLGWPWSTASRYGAQQLGGGSGQLRAVDDGSTRWCSQRQGHGAS